MKILSHKDPSDPQSWIDLLLPMEGKLFMIMGTQERVLHHECIEGKVLIKTDRRTREFIREDLYKFLEGIEPISEGITVIEPRHEAPELKEVMESSGMALLQKKLMATIEKVESDPSYVGQAQTINNLAKTVMNMANTQIQYLKTK